MGEGRGERGLRIDDGGGGGDLFWRGGEGGKVKNVQ